MVELRKNPLTREWALVATEPEDTRDAENGCPYCPGNEQRSGPELLAYRDPNSDSNAPGWRVRVVADRPSQLQPEGDPGRRDEGIYDTMRAVGGHELILETPSHTQAAIVSDVQQSQDALWACRERYARWEGLDFVKAVVVARHYPAREPQHPHWRLLALPVVPQRLWELAKGMAQYYDYRGRCGVCHIIEADREDGRRLVAENRHFVALAPYASTHPYELWIAPRRHQPTLLHTQRQEMQSLARIIADTVSALQAALRESPCGMTFWCAPCNIEGMEHFHWLLRLLPSATANGQGALACGIAVNPVAPEIAARRLRRNAATLIASRI